MDGQTHEDSICRASIASRGKNAPLSKRNWGLHGESCIFWHL